MNSREITEVSIKLKGIVDAVGQGALENIAKEIEAAVLKPFGVFDSTVIRKMKDSQDRVGHYTIQADDMESIKSIKAVINILRSTSAATNTVIQPAVEGVMTYMKTGSKVGAVKGAVLGAVGVTTDYLGAKWTDLWRPAYVENDGQFNPANAPTQNRVDQALQLVGDVSAVKFYMGQISSVLPDLAGVSAETKETLMRLQNALDNTVVMNAAVAIQDLSNTNHAMGGAIDLANAATQKTSATSLDRSLQAVKAAATGAIGVDDHAKYFDKKGDKYRLPKPGSPEMQSISPDNQKLMIAFNVTDRARKAMARVNEFMDTWNKTKSLPLSQLPAMLEILNKIGKMVKETQQLDNSELGQLIKADLDEAIKQVLTTVGSTLPQLASIAQETELKLGLRDNKLLGNLESIAKQYETVATSYRVPVTVKYPYPEQKNGVIKKLHAEAETKKADLGAAIESLSGRDYQDLKSLQHLISLQKQARLIKSPAGGEFLNEVGKMIDRATGMDKLAIDIKRAEDKLYQLSQETVVDDKDLHKASIKEAIADVRKLYEIRDQLQSKNEKADEYTQHYVTDKSGVGELEPGLISVSASKTFKEAAKAAITDARGLMKAENNMIDRLNRIGDANRKLLDPSKDVKLNRLNAVQGVKGAAIATMRGQIADEKRQSRGASYANIQKKVTQLDDTAILQGVIQQKKGGVIVQCEASRKSMLDSAKQFLSESQSNALSTLHKTYGLYTIAPGDGLLVMNIKQMSNTLFRLEELMGKLNQVSSYIEAGGLSYLSIPTMLPIILKDMTNLLQEVKASNETVLQLRDSVGHTLSAELQQSMEGVFQAVNRNFPSKLLDICTDVEAEVLASIDPAYEAKSRELFTQAKSFIANTDSLIRKGRYADQPAASMSNASSNTSSVEVLSAKVDVGMINAMLDLLQKKIEVPNSGKRKSGQLYKLSDFKSGTPEMMMAGLSNALANLSGSLQATVKISNTKGMLGGVDLVKNLYGLYNALAEATPSILMAMQPQIKAILESVDPIMTQLYASAAVTEKTVGLKEKTLTGTLDPVCKSYEILAATYGATLKEAAPYYSAQLELAQKEQLRIMGEKGKPEANTALLAVQAERVTPIVVDMRARMEEGAARVTVRG
jgi:hypothetical protein